MDSVTFYQPVLFRGYFIWVFPPWLGWWGDAALSLLFFALGHVVYQGWNELERGSHVRTMDGMLVPDS